MELEFRIATIADFDIVKDLVIASFEPITWQKKLDQSMGALNGVDWQERWNARLRAIFKTQLVLLGEQEGQIAAMATATVDQPTALAFIDVLAVAKDRQGRGFGRQ